MKILNFGSCNIDYVYSVDHMVEKGETLDTFSLEIFPGGKGLNQSIAAARAGAEIYHAGIIGEDGDFLRELLSENQTDTTYLKKLPFKNGHAIIQVDKHGENSIILYGGSNRMVSEEYIDKVLENFCADDMILLQNEISCVPYLINKAYEKGMAIAFNPAPFDESLKNIDLNKISFLILNEVEARGLTGTDDSDKSLMYLREKHPHLKIVLTLGAKGCLYADNEKRVFQPAFKVEAVDTTAAGDTFIGYFLWGYTHTPSIEAALKTACAASALTVSKKGAAPSIPYINEVKSALDVLEVRSVDKKERIKKQIESYVDNNIVSVKLGDLAVELSYSSNYVGELIVKLFGESFSDMLKRKRCERAANLLRETDLPVEEIIDKVGYQNKSFFRNAFKEKYEVSPLQYRKMK